MAFFFLNKNLVIFIQNQENSFYNLNYFLCNFNSILYYLQKFYAIKKKK